MRAQIKPYSKALNNYHPIFALPPKLFATNLLQVINSPLKLALICSFLSRFRDLIHACRNNPYGLKASLYQQIEHHLFSALTFE